MEDSTIVHGQELVFDEEKHMYTWGGAPVPGVTTILQKIAKPALIGWAANMASDYWLEAIRSGRVDYSAIHKEGKSAHRKRTQAAADSGTNVHEYAEAYFKSRSLPELTTDAAKKGAEAFHKWVSSHNIEIIASERRIFSKEFFYAGTCDFIAKIDGVYGVGDIKTSSGIYPEMRFQTAAYQHALQEEKGVKFPIRWIIRFDKVTGDFEVKSFDNFDLDFTGFLAALRLHKTLKLIEDGQ